MISSKNLEQDGIEIIPDFFSTHEIELLRKECDYLFSYSTITGPSFSHSINPCLKEVAHPIASIRSVNLLQKCFELLLYLEEKPNFIHKNFKLANVALYSEENNSKPLFWHSDIRQNGLIRVQVCITGGNTQDSGAFTFLPTTHLFENIIPVPTDKQISDLEIKPVVSSFPNGTAVLFDSTGYHCKTPCILRRVSIMIDLATEDYLENNLNDILSNFRICPVNFSPMVLANLKFLPVNMSRNSKSPNTYDYFEYNHFLGGAFSKNPWVIKFVIRLFRLFGIK